MLALCLYVAIESNLFISYVRNYIRMTKYKVEITATYKNVLPDNVGIIVDAAVLDARYTELNDVSAIDGKRSHMYNKKLSFTF